MSTDAATPYAIIKIVPGKRAERAYLSVPAPIPEDTNRVLNTGAVASWDETTRIATTASGSKYDLTGMLISVLGGPKHASTIQPDQPIPWETLGFMPYVPPSGEVES